MSLSLAIFTETPIAVWAPQVATLLDAVGDIAYVGGGAARQLVLPDAAPDAWDIDLFLYEGGSLMECKRRLLALGYTQESFTEHSSQFHPPVREGNLDVQIIEFFQDEWSLTSGEPEDVLSHFSFTTELFAVAIRNGTAVAIVGDNAIPSAYRRPPGGQVRL
jgi:hypothetical protein